MLDILAKRVDGRATIDDVLEEMASADGQESSAGFPELDGVDVLQAGLVVVEDESLRITEAGRSVLRAIEAVSEPTATLDGSQSLKRIDDLIGVDMRQKIFDLD